MSAEVQPGYKQTEAGLIPNDWDCLRLKQLLAQPIQNGIFNDPKHKGYGYKLINVGDLYKDAPINTSKLDFLYANKADVGRFKVVVGDIFFTRSSITPDGIAHCNIFSSSEKEPVLFDCHIVRARVIFKKINPFFLFRYCTAKPARQYLTANAKTTTMTTIDQGVIENLPIIVPPLEEQKFIASALYDIDALIVGLNVMIAKKRDIQQAAMQQLLTGQHRLPGFSGDWETKRLGELAIFLKGQGLSKNDLVAEGVRPCIHYGELFTHYPVTIKEITSRTNNKLAGVLSKENDVLMPTSDVTPKGLAKASCITLSGVVLGGDILIIRPSLNLVNGSFLSYVIRYCENQVLKLVSGSTVFHLYGADMKRFQFMSPPIEEQIAIATLLSGMDTEIAALGAKRDKALQLKQGMMQGLLTGRIRPSA